MEVRQRATEAAAAAVARVDALQLALDTVHARAGAEALAAVDGVLGTLLDLVRIDAGWEPSVEAALGEALTAVVVRDPAAGAAALDVLRSSQTAGAVLSQALPAPTAPHELPVGDPVRPHVHAERAAIGTMLDRLLHDAVRVDDLDAALEAAIDHPDAVVVTAGGDRFGSVGWRVGSSSAGLVTAAALEDAVADAARRHREAEQRAADELVAAERDATARRHLAELKAQLAANDATLTAASAGLTSAQTSGAKPSPNWNRCCVASTSSSSTSPPNRPVSASSKPSWPGSRSASKRRSTPPGRARSTSWRSRRGRAC